MVLASSGGRAINPPVSRSTMRVPTAGAKTNRSAPRTKARDSVRGSSRPAATPTCAVGEKGCWLAIGAITQPRTSAPGMSIAEKVRLRVWLRINLPCDFTPPSPQPTPVSLIHHLPPLGRRRLILGEYRPIAQYRVVLDAQALQLLLAVHSEHDPVLPRRALPRRRDRIGHALGPGAFAPVPNPSRCRAGSTAHDAAPARFSRAGSSLPCR